MHDVVAWDPCPVMAIEGGHPHLALRARLVERGIIGDAEQLFMVTDEELDQLRADPEPFRELIAARWQQYRLLFDYEPVFVVNRVVPPLSAMTRRDAKQVAAAVAGDVSAAGATLLTHENCRVPSGATWTT